MNNSSTSLEDRVSSLYAGQLVAVATKHEKERALSLPMRAALGLEVVVPEGIDTDALGSFTGEGARVGHPREVAAKKARLGMAKACLSLGIASEGSFGPHPHAPFIAGNQEILVFADDNLGIEVTEQMLSMDTNFAHCRISSSEDLPEDFLHRVRFPSHALIARPDTSCKPSLIKKGISSIAELQEAIEGLSTLSANGVVRLETDMRAHVNPTRMRVIRRTAIKLARRLRAHCPECTTPGWGIVDIKKGLPCRLCRWPTEFADREIYACPKCDYRRELPRQDGLKEADPRYCPLCNP